MTRIEKVQNGMHPALIRSVARSEHVSPGVLAGGIADGTVVIPCNRLRSLKKPCAVGKGLRTKVNANIGTSTDFSRIDFELRKLRAAESFGADTVMDLSTSKNLKAVRAAILKNARVPLGTVPVYETAFLGIRSFGSIEKTPESFFIETIRQQAREGVDFFTIHAGITLKTVDTLKGKNRIMGVVSRGGAMLIEWMIKNGKENPLFRHFSEIVDIAREYDVTLSLGDGMRPGAIADATDEPQIDELLTLGRLQKRAFARGVQVIIEGPGHVPLHHIKANVELEKSICNGAPFYVLGPLVTDIAPGYDHVTSAIGGAVAAAHGADFLCYVTPAEHLSLPEIDDVKEGVITSRIAAHAADIAKNAPGAAQKDRAISQARFSRDWKKQFALSIDPGKCKSYRKRSSPRIKDVCTMCGEYCAIKISERCLKKEKEAVRL
jgi:phosphomethylpyrimidine synthase